ncbi:MAG: hypothetical protein Q7T03_09505 [Deltaproteobacteria bacterium]|nr:hypothetical protein [Deltaproteobacteria bacterium]
MKKWTYHLFLAVCGAGLILGAGCKDGSLPVAQTTLGSDEVLRQEAVAEGKKEEADNLDLFKAQPQTAHLDLENKKVTIDVGDPKGERYLNLTVSLFDFFPQDVTLASHAELQVHYSIPQKATLVASQGDITFEKTGIVPGSSIIIHVKKAMVEGIELNGDIIATMDDSGTDKPLILSFSPDKAAWKDKIVLKGLNFPITPDTGLKVSLGSASFPLEPVSPFEAQFHIDQPIDEDALIVIKKGEDIVAQSLVPLEHNISFVNLVPMENRVSSLVFNPLIQSLMIGFADDKNIGFFLSDGTLKKIEVEDFATTVDVSQQGSRVAVCHQTLSQIGLFNLVGEIDNSPVAMQIALPPSVRCLSAAFGSEDHLMALVETQDKKRRLVFVDAKNGALSSQESMEVPFEKLVRSPMHDRILAISTSINLAQVWEYGAKGFEPMTPQSDLKVSDAACFDAKMGYFFSGNQLLTHQLNVLGDLQVAEGKITPQFVAGVFSPDSRTIFALTADAQIYSISSDKLEIGSAIPLFKKSEEESSPKILGPTAVSTDGNYWFIATDKGLAVVDLKFISDSIQK